MDKGASTRIFETTWVMRLFGQPNYQRRSTSWSCLASTTLRCHSSRSRQMCCAICFQRLTSSPLPRNSRMPLLRCV
eukprot:symbB.v1.2.011862.t1/scaffold807.1/size160841/7